MSKQINYGTNPIPTDPDMKIRMSKGGVDTSKFEDVVVLYSAKVPGGCVPETGPVKAYDVANDPAVQPPESSRIPLTQDGDAWYMTLGDVGDTWVLVQLPVVDCTLTWFPQWNEIYIPSPPGLADLTIQQNGLGHPALNSIIIHLGGTTTYVDRLVRIEVFTRFGHTLLEPHFELRFA